GRSLACQALQSLFACLFDAFVYLSSFSLSSVFCIWSLSLCFLSHLPYFLSTTTTDFRLYVQRACTHPDKRSHTHTKQKQVLSRLPILDRMASKNPFRNSFRLSYQTEGNWTKKTTPRKHQEMP